MDTPLVEFRNVVKQFGENRVLNGINLKIYENQITTIIGKSGTGKSVLLKHIIGLLRPDDGVILFNGNPVHEMKRTEWDSHRAKISYMFQNNALFDSASVFDNIALPLRKTTNLSKTEIAHRVMIRIEQMDLADVIDKYPSELSGGMQKRVALARALVTDPSIVLFDEPTTGQDPIRKNAILSMIAHYRKQFGFTAVLISHDIPDVFFVSDRIILLWEGTVAFQGTYEESRRLKHPLIDEFFRSIAGFQDELTGLLSKEMFRAHYSMLFGGSKRASTSCAILFGVEFDHLEEHLGLEATLEVLKSLGEYTNRYFEPMGGFSMRHARGRIITMLPHTSITEGREVVSLYARHVQADALPPVEALVQASLALENCFDIVLFAGVCEVTTDDDIDDIILKAGKEWKVIATYDCASGGKTYEI